MTTRIASSSCLPRRSLDEVGAKSKDNKRAPRYFTPAINSHPYLSALLPIIQKTPLTVTYNFDDFLERALYATKSQDDKSRGFETVTNPWIQFRRESGVVYHPNGVIKSELMELPADKFIFSESSFARQTVGGSGDTKFLVSHFCKNTCLVIGASLEDESLRSTLIWSAETNSGNFHYCVHFLRKRSSLTKAETDAIRRANFNVFNLITLFLTEPEIAALAQLIDPGQISDDDLRDIAEQEGVPLVYKYYLTGAIGVGKSETARQLENLSVIDEWLEPRISILAKPWDELTTKERDRADAWIVNQFKLKNDKLRHETPGVFIIDRPPLDPLAFTPANDRPAKAKLLLETICPRQKWGIVPGAVILFTGDPQDLALRVLLTGRDDYTAERLERMQKDLCRLYRGAGVITIDIRGMAVRDVTKKVAEMIFFDGYREYQLGKRLRRYT